MESPSIVPREKAKFCLHSGPSWCRLMGLQLLLLVQQQWLPDKGVLKKCFAHLPNNEQRVCYDGGQ